MNVYISTDNSSNIDWTKKVPHKKENWESPLMDKCNNAFDYLQSIKSNAEFYCHFDSLTQSFTPNYELCSGLSKTEIEELINTINNFS